MLKNISFMILISIACITINSSTANAQTNGSISGAVADSLSSEAMIGAVARLDGTNLGAVVFDDDGSFMIPNVPEGSYTLIISMVGYVEKRVGNVVVTAGTVTDAGTVLVASDAIDVGEITVRARAIRDTDAALNQERKEEEAVSDAVSAEAISRAGSGNAAEAVKQVTGATVVDGKSVYVRGLGDRYTNVQLNGSELPSTSQYNQTVQIDLFPSNLINNIVTQKTFTPDKPGAFTGGSVNIETKSFPEALALSVSASTSYTEETTFSKDFLTYPGGSKDWLGYDDGTRDIPEVLAGTDVKDTDIGLASQNIEAAHQLDSFSKAFDSIMTPTTRSAPVNQSYSVTFGNRIQAAGRPLGFLGSLTYSNNFSSYTDGKSARWNLTSPTAGALDDYMNLSDSKSTESVLWGGLLNSSYRLSDNNEIGVNIVHSQNGESYARSLAGTYGENISDNATFVPNVLGYNERTLTTAQFSGTHSFPAFLGMKVEWKSSVSKSKENEPDLRYFTYTYSDGFNGDKSYIVFANFYDGPTRYYRYLKENTLENKIDVDVPFKQWGGRESTFKFGGQYSTKERSFSERQFTFERDKYVQFTGDPDAFFSETNVGLVDSTRTPYRFGMYVVDLSNNASRYDGDQTIKALYSMVDMPLAERLRFIGGVRYETTYLKVANPDTSGVIEIDDFLPSVNLVYQPSETMNIRTAYSRTLARPTIREMAPYTSFDYAASNFFIGNPHLERTLIDNYDVRWEWFPSINDVYAVSLFVKNFDNPIERVIKNYNGEITFQNVDFAFVRGIELEARRSIPYLPGFRLRRQPLPH